MSRFILTADDETLALFDKTQRFYGCKSRVDTFAKIVKKTRFIFCPNCHEIASEVSEIENEIDENGILIRCGNCKKQFKYELNFDKGMDCPHCLNVICVDICKDETGECPICKGKFKPEKMKNFESWFLSKLE
jgi:uncharacterized CHY-type Zn-finger protein